MANNMHTAISDPVIAAMIGFDTLRIAVCIGSRINVRISTPSRALISARLLEVYSRAKCPAVR